MIFLLRKLYITIILGAFFSTPYAFADQDITLMYLDYVEDNRVREVIDVYSLKNWNKNSSKNFFYRYSNARDMILEFVSINYLNMETKSIREALFSLPDIQKNRMVLNIFMRKGNFLTDYGSQIAFMARVIRDGKLVRWRQLGKGTQMGLVKRTKTFRYNHAYYLNCSQFVEFAAYLAGFPEWKETSTSLIHNDMSTNLIAAADTSSMNSWQGWWRPYFDSNHEPLLAKKMFLQKGDLLMLFMGIKNPGDDNIRYEFYHVEIVTKDEVEAGSKAGVESIGNTRKGGISFSRQMSSSMRTLRWLHSASETFNFSEDAKIADWRLGAFKLKLNNDFAEKNIKAEVTLEIK